MKATSHADDPVMIDFSKVSEQTRNELGAIGLAGVREFFAQPGTREKFERWKKERLPLLKQAMTNGGSES